jgi:glycosyltransferase involved in cell wall biosynthesis
VLDFSVLLNSAEFGISYGFLKQNGIVGKILERQGYPVYDISTNLTSATKVFVHISKLRRLIRQHNIDVVHVYSTYPSLIAMIACLFTQTKIISSIVHHPSRLTKKHRLIYRGIGIFAKAIHVNAKDNAVWLSTHLGIHKRKIWYIPNPVVNHCKYLGKKTGCKLVDPNYVSVGMVGTLRPIKNPRLFVEAAEIVLSKTKAVKFYIAGEGPLKEEIENIINRKGLSDHVKLLGQIFPIDAFMNQLDVLALSSDSEGCPTCVCEAVTYGIPVVSTAVGGVLDLVQHGKNGVLVRSKDPGEFADALLYVTEDHNVRAAMADYSKRLKKAEFTTSFLKHRLSAMYSMAAKHTRS